MTKKSQSRLRNFAVMVAVALVWLGFDFVTKALVNDGSRVPGDFISGPYLGLIDFVLVHNTGGAWGIFGDSTFVLGVFSIVVCVGLAVFVTLADKDASLAEHVFIGLVIAGGVGNAIDRFTLGYVVDFIHTTFIDFPVFNVADIGVTCGLIGYMAMVFWRMHKMEKAEAEAEAEAATKAGE